MQLYVAMEPGGQVYGPYSEADVERMIAEGRLRPGSYLSEDGGPWAYFSQSPRFGHLFQREAPPTAGAPPAAQAADEMGELAAAARASHTGYAAGAAYGRPAAYGTAYQRASHQGTAVAGFVCSLVGLILCPIVFSLIGLIVSASALSSMKRSRNDEGKGLATAGVVIGVIGLVVYVLLIALVIIGSVMTA